MFKEINSGKVGKLNNSFGSKSLLINSSYEKYYQYIKTL